MSQQVAPYHRPPRTQELLYADDIVACETFKDLKHISRKGDYFVSLNLADGYYTLFGKREEDDKDFFTSIQLKRRTVAHDLSIDELTVTSIGVLFCKLTYVLANHLRRISAASSQTPPSSTKASRRLLRNARDRGVCMLLVYSTSSPPPDSRLAAFPLRDRRHHIEAPMDSLGLQRNAAKGIWESAQIGDHLSLTVGLTKGEIIAPTDKLQAMPRTPSPWPTRARRQGALLVPCLVTRLVRMQSSSTSRLCQHSSAYVSYNASSPCKRACWGVQMKLTHRASSNASTQVLTGLEMVDDHADATQWPPHLHAHGECPFACSL
jgi:hypothetical protein